MLCKWDKVLDFIYPCRCILCGRVIYIAEEVKICPNCEKDAKKIEPPYCVKCGKRLEGQAEGCCGDCESKSFDFERGGALWPYEGKRSRAVLDLKFNRKLENGRTLGILCTGDIIEKRLADNIDVIAPVPLHWAKYLKRGYNQAEIIARVIGKRLGLPVDSNILKRVRSTIPQMELNYEERIKNIEGSIKAATSQNLVGRRILLIDDIFTTGSTLNECAGALKRNGAASVNCYCVCISYDKTGLYPYI